MIASLRKLKKMGLLGLNCRNGEFILPNNHRKFYPLVDNKVLCKERLLRQGLPVPDLIGVIAFMHQTSHINDVLGEHTEFVIKPAHGSGGDGILVTQVDAVFNDRLQVDEKVDPAGATVKRPMHPILH